MTDMFSTNSVPTQLDEYRLDLNISKIEEGLFNLGYQKGSPGWKAIQSPVTPIDKAFQIYALKLVHSNNFQPESTQHETLWARREKAWLGAARWLYETQDVFKDMGKKETTALFKVLPDALRCQCSLELPPGPFEIFPRDGKKKTKDVDLCMDTLQHLGWNRKITAIAILDGDTQYEKKPQPKNYGTLKEMQESLTLNSDSPCP